MLKGNEEKDDQSILHFSCIKCINKGLRDLYGLLNCSMSLVFTFLCTTNQAKARTFKGAFDFQTNLAKRYKNELEKKIENKPKENKNQALEPMTEGDKVH